MPVYARDPDAVYVSIFCNGTGPGREHDPWRIASFVRDYEPTIEAPDHRVWNESVQGYYSPGSRVLTKLSGRVTARLVGDHYVSRTESDSDPEVFEKGDPRTRYRFHCPTCRLSVATKGKSVGPLLDKFAAAEISEVSLHAFSSRLSTA